jgi:hypothetical protein
VKGDEALVVFAQPAAPALGSGDDPFEGLLQVALRDRPGVAARGEEGGFV